MRKANRQSFSYTGCPSCCLVQKRFPHGVASRGIFCSRTLSLRSITTIGYDMDYTLIHYNVNVSSHDVISGLAV